MGLFSSDSNDDQINEQKEQEALARRKESERVARLNAALAKITDAFQGKQTATTPTNVDWSKVVMPRYGGRQELEFNGTTPAGLPAGYTIQGNGNDAWIIKGPNGKVVNFGDAITYSAPSGPRSGGFDKAFYDKYRNSMVDFYKPEVARQYGDAQKELTYRLARAGTLKSQAASDTGADLIRQKVENDAMVSDKADTAKGALVTNVAGLENTARSLVNAAEDPSVEANTQLSQLAGAKVGLAQPDLSPLGEIFKVAAIGGANALSGYTSGRTSADIAAARKKYNSGYGATTTIS